MNTTIRRIAVSGSAAVALLGGAAAINMSAAPDASATEISTAIDQATGAPVNLPDGRVMHIRGLDTAGYQADAAHHTAVVRLAADTNPGTTGGTYNDQTGTGTGQQNPTVGNGVSYTPAQVQTQAGGGTIAIGIVVIIVLGTIAFFRVKGSAKVGDAVLFAFLGVAMSGTVFGVMAKTMSEQGVGSLGGILGGLG
ncbi:MAG TPA: hypothetical protein VK698_39370 [Kofleriaceae bacterium]|nr:hypothetical protein [Kofleriaceae bacterium]